MSKHQQWKMLHLLNNNARRIGRGSRRVLTEDQLTRAGVHCDGDSRWPLEEGKVVIRQGNKYALSRAASIILNTFTVTRGPETGGDIRVDYPEAFVVMPFTQPWSERVYTEMFRPGILKAGFTVCRGDSIVRVGDLSKNVWGRITQAGVIVADISVPNPNVFYEIGLADALGKPVFLFIQNGVVLPADFGGAHYYQYDLEDLEAGHETLTTALDQWARDIDHRPFGVKSLVDQSSVV